MIKLRYIYFYYEKEDHSQSQYRKNMIDSQLMLRVYSLCGDKAETVVAEKPALLFPP